MLGLLSPEFCSHMGLWFVWSLTEWKIFISLYFPNNTSDQLYVFVKMLVTVRHVVLITLWTYVYIER